MLLEKRDMNNISFRGVLIIYANVLETDLDMLIWVMGSCYVHAMDLHFTLTSSIGFILTNHIIGSPQPPAAHHLLCSI